MQIIIPEHWGYKQNDVAYEEPEKSQLTRK